MLQAATDPDKKVINYQDYVTIMLPDTNQTI